MSTERADRAEHIASVPTELQNPYIVVIGASAGGVPVLQNILTSLPRQFPAVICAVVHIPAWRRSLLPTVLSISSRAAVEPVNHQPLKPGCVYVAAPDHHLIVDTVRRCCGTARRKTLIARR